MASPSGYGAYPVDRNFIPNIDPRLQGPAPSRRTPSSKAASSSATAQSLLDSVHAPQRFTRSGRRNGLEYSQQVPLGHRHIGCRPSRLLYDEDGTPREDFWKVLSKNNRFSDLLENLDACSMGSQGQALLYDGQAFTALFKLVRGVLTMAVEPEEQFTRPQMAIAAGTAPYVQGTGHSQQPIGQPDPQGVPLNANAQSFNSQGWDQGRPGQPGDSTGAGAWAVPGVPGVEGLGTCTDNIGTMLPMSQQPGNNYIQTIAAAPTTPTAAHQPAVSGFRGTTDMPPPPGPITVNREPKTPNVKRPPTARSAPPGNNASKSKGKSKETVRWKDDPDGKKEENYLNMRKIGVCLKCRRNKTKCDPSHPGKRVPRSSKRTSQGESEHDDALSVQTM